MNSLRVWTRWMKVLIIAWSYLLDSANYIRYSGTFLTHRNQVSWQSDLVMRYHCIEKALSLKDTRPGFGKERVAQLVRSLRKYMERYGGDDIAGTVIGVLQAYSDYNDNVGYSDKGLRGEIEALKSLACFPKDVDLQGGVLRVTGETVKCQGFDFDGFSASRFSIRNFADGQISMEEVEAAVRIAQKTPSACNRQPWVVHAYQDPEDIRRLCAHQIGNQGFGDAASAMLVVTSPLSCFFGAGERNQAFIDGGMFCMSLVYALHSLGLGTCCLNLRNNTRHASGFRKASGIPAQEVLIMMIAVGKLPQQLDVAMSQRKSLDKVLHMH